MKKFLNKIDKYFVHHAYYTFTNEEEYQGYDELTRYKMHDVLCAKFQYEPSLIAEALSIETLKNLQLDAHSIQETGWAKLSDFMPHEYVKRGVFLICEIKDENESKYYKMSPNVVSFLIAMEIDRELEERKLFVDVLYGILEVYGLVLHEDVYRIYKRVRPKKYAPVKMPTLESYPFLQDELLYRDYRVYQNAYVHPLVEEYDIKLELYEELRLYDLAFYLRFNAMKRPIEMDSLFKNIPNRDLFYEDESANINGLIQPLEIEALIESLKNTHETLMERIHTWPIWRLGGRSLNDFIKEDQSFRH